MGNAHEACHCTGRHAPSSDGHRRHHDHRRATVSVGALRTPWNVAEKVLARTGEPLVLATGLNKPIPSHKQRSACETSSEQKGRRVVLGYQYPAAATGASESLRSAANPPTTPSPPCSAFAMLCVCETRGPDLWAHVRVECTYCRVVRESGRVASGAHGTPF